MRITGSFPVTASVDKARRRIIGMIVPFGEVGHAGVDGKPADIVIEAGGLAWDDVNAVKLVIDHNGDKPVMAGKARDLVETDEGVIGTFSVVPTIFGDQALVEAAEQLRVGLSIEADLPHTSVGEDGQLRITAENPARLHRVALVETPAFARAQVTEVSAQKADTMTDVTAAEVPDDQLSEAVSALQAIAETLAGNLPAAQEEEAMPEEAPAEASRPARVPAVASSMTASTVVTREPFVYGHPGAEGRSLFQDIMHASANGNVEAAQRVDKAQKMIAEAARLTAADEQAVTTDITIPNTYAPYVPQIEFPRVAANRFHLAGVLTSSRPILVPTFEGLVADGGSGEVVSSHSEGSNPTSGEVDVDYSTVSPGAYSGKVDVSRLAVDAGDPSVDVVIMGGIKESWAQVTESAACAVLEAGAGNTTDSSTTDASTEVEARNMYKLVRKHIAKFSTRRGVGPSAVLMASTQFEEAAAADNATTGNPLYPAFNPTNTQSRVIEGYDYGGSLEIRGIPGLNTPKLTSTKVMIIRDEDVWRWEGPLLQFKWEEVGGPDTVRFVGWGYAIYHIAQPKGVTELTQA